MRVVQTHRGGGVSWFDLTRALGVSVVNSGRISSPPGRRERAAAKLVRKMSMRLASAAAFMRLARRVSRPAVYGWVSASSLLLVACFSQLAVLGKAVD